MMKIALPLMWAAAAAFMALSAGAATAGTQLVVQMDQSQLMDLSGDPGSIIVGNPSIADVSLDGRRLFIHGHSFGETNLMIFDTSGKKIGDYDVTVSHDTENQLSMFIGNSKGSARYTYSCAPNCEQNMMAGDETGFMQQAVSNNRTKYSYATGVASGTVSGYGGSAGGGASAAPQ